MDSWSFLTNHARVLLRIAREPGTRMRDIAGALRITERTAYSIVTDLPRTSSSRRTLSAGPEVCRRQARWPVAGGARPRGRPAPGPGRRPAGGG